MAEESKEYTTFSVSGRKFQYKRLPFGIKIGPKVFQETMNQILGGIKNVSVYIDDIIISTSTKEEHLEILSEVLDRLKDKKVEINFEKSCFMANDLEILGNRF